MDPRDCKCRNLRRIGVSEKVHGSSAGGIECVEELDRVRASDAGEVTVVAVDGRQTGSHVAREVEG
jgi:hypothetical protein